VVGCWGRPALFESSRFALLILPVFIIITATSSAAGCCACTSAVASLLLRVLLLLLVLSCPPLLAALQPLLQIFVQHCSKAYALVVWQVLGTQAQAGRMGNQAST
jgi:hypothetical protein